MVVVLVEFHCQPIFEPHHDAIQKFHVPSRRRNLGSAGACKRAGVSSLKPQLQATKVALSKGAFDHHLSIRERKSR